MNYPSKEKRKEYQKFVIHCSFCNQNLSYEGFLQHLNTNKHLLKENSYANEHGVNEYKKLIDTICKINKSTNDKEEDDLFIKNIKSILDKKIDKGLL